MRTSLLFLVSAASLAAETYTIRPEPGAKFTLEVHKTGLMSGKVHVFEYERYEGQLDLDAARPEAAKIELTIAAASIVCRDTWVDEKDRKKITALALETMQHANHPEMSFVSTAIARRSDGTFDVTGNLTLKGITKPSKIAVTMKQDGVAWVFTGKSTVLRKDYKINPPAPVPFGIIGNKQEMPVAFTLIARPR
jgi:polyisoprenoid-binding protein YceI